MRTTKCLALALLIACAGDPGQIGSPSPDLPNTDPRLGQRLAPSASTQPEPAPNPIGTPQGPPTGAGGTEALPQPQTPPRGAGAAPGSVMPPPVVMAAPNPVSQDHTVVRILANVPPQGSCTSSADWQDAGSLPASAIMFRWQLSRSGFNRVTIQQIVPTLPRKRIGPGDDGPLVDDLAYDVSAPAATGWPAAVKGEFLFQGRDPKVAYTIVISFIKNGIGPEMHSFKIPAWLPR